MSSQEMRSYKKQRRIREVAAKKRILFLLCSAFIIVMGCVFYGNAFSSGQASAQNSETEYKYYKSVTIKNGDTLWSIAQEYGTGHASDTRAYVEELKELNGLTSDQIHQGQHLVVSYYDTEYR